MIKFNKILLRYHLLGNLEIYLSLRWYDVVQFKLPWFCNRNGTLGQLQES